jgi:hypothetical protein
MLHRASELDGFFGMARTTENGYNIRMDLTEIGWEGVDWMHLSQDRDQWWAVVKMVMNLRVP